MCHTHLIVTQIRNENITSTTEAPLLPLPSTAPMENLKKVTSVIYIAALVHGDGASTRSATIPAQLHRARETRVEISEVSRLAWRKHKSCQ